MATFDNDEKNISYALGMNMCEYISHLPIKIDVETFSKAFSDFHKDGKFQFDNDEYRKYMTMFQEQAQEAGKAAIAEKVEVSDNELDFQLNMMSRYYGFNAKEMRSTLEKNGGIDELRTDLINGKVLEKLSSAALN